MNYIVTSPYIYNHMILHTLKAKEVTDLPDSESTIHHLIKS